MSIPFGWGSSETAPGGKAAAVCLEARDLGAPQPAVQVLVYPATDWRLETLSARDCADSYGLSTDDMRWSWEQYVPDAEQRSDPLVSPLHSASMHGLAPAVVITAEFDILRDEGRLYADRLEGDGVPVVRHEYPGTIHGFLWMNAAVDECGQMLEDVAHDVAALVTR